MTRREGFTLVELLVVVMILGALAMVSVPRMTAAANRAKINACKTNVKSLNSQIEMWYADKGTWPDTLSDVADNAEYFPDGAPECPFGLAYSYNTTTHRVTSHNHDGVTPAPEPVPVPEPEPVPVPLPRRPAPVSPSL
ncbi:MAG: prepilin-type N-terminal cleavage/methylation domain-containing protein [Sedimentisphaerales bacterium]|nr:prepilin-type N-terminal cleavage/methylation domain-containing protein [Sedimentisphaerales bacterium]